MADTDMARHNTMWATMPPNPYHHMAIQDNQIHAVPMLVTDGGVISLYPAPQANPNARLTKPQHKYLEDQFRRCQKPTTAYKKELAVMMNVAPDKINNWFQNRRAKQKQKDKNGDADEEVVFAIASPEMEHELSNNNQQSYESSLSGHSGEMTPVWPPNFTYSLNGSTSMDSNADFQDAVQVLPSFPPSNHAVSVLRSTSIPGFPLLSQDYPEERPSPVNSHDQVSYPPLQQPVARRQHLISNFSKHAEQLSSETERPAISPSIPTLSHTASTESLDVKNPFELVEQNGTESSKPRGMMNGNRRRGAPPALQLGGNRLGASIPNPMPSPAEMRRASSSAISHRIQKSRMPSGPRSPSMAQVEQMKQWAAAQAQGPSHTLHPPPTPLTPFDQGYLLSSTADHFPDLGTPVSSGSEGVGSMNARMPPVSASLPPHLLPLTSPPITPHTTILRSGHLTTNYFTPPQSAPATKTHFAAMPGENVMITNSYMNNDNASRRPSLPFNQFNDDGMSVNPTVSMAQLTNLNAPMDSIMMSNGIDEQQAGHHHNNWFGATSMSMSSESLHMMQNDGMGYLSSDMSDHTLESRSGSLAESISTTPSQDSVDDQNVTPQASTMDSTQFIQFDPNAIRVDQASKAQKLEELRFVNSHPSNFIGSK